MSDNLPIEVQMNIMKRLPVKPLLRCRSVSKTWKSIIDSSHFIAHYQGKVQHLLVSYSVFCPDKPNIDRFISVVDDDTFPQKKVSLFVPEFVKELAQFSVIGCSHGLLCLDAKKGHYSEEFEDICDSSSFENENHIAVLWNIATRKTVAVVTPSPVYGFRNVLGFGVCGTTNEPKIVKIKIIDSRSGRDKESIRDMPWQVEVFTFSTGIWRNVSNNIPRMSIELFRSQVVIDESLYWLASDMSSNMIISFDITTEEFRQVNLPDSLAQDLSHENLYISKLRKSLVVLQRDDGVDNNLSLNVWMMEDGISKSFTKLYTIYLPGAYIQGVFEFRMNGLPIIELSERSMDPYSDSSLVVYEPYTKRIEEIGIDGIYLSFYVSSYMETLHLHDQRNSTVWYYETSR